MADIYAVVDKSKKKNRSPCKEENTVGGAFMSPLYDAVEADLESRSVPVDNQGPGAEYSVLARDGVYPRALPAGAAATTAHGNNQIAGKHDKAKSTSEDVSCKRFICILVTITLVTLISLACLAVLFAEIAKLKSQSVSPDQQTSSSQQIHNESVFMSQLEQINKSLTSIQDQITTLSREEMENNAAQSNNINISIGMQLTTLYNQTQQLSNSNTMLQQQLDTLHNQTQQLSDSNSMLQQQLTTLHNKTQQLNNSNTMIEQKLNVIYPVTSCAALPPYSPSGYYLISASNGSAVNVYCDMTLSCGGVTGRWMRVAFLDMTNSSHQCPSGLMGRIDSPNIRTCVRNEASGGCSSVELSTANIQYSTVCGRITAYQVGSPDDFRVSNNDINSAYVDGVSLTHGTSRQHIWTFAAAGREDGICNPCRTQSRPASVGNDFFCDSGNPMSSNDKSNTFHSDNPLWDGVGCTAGICCPTDNPPYFHKTLQPTTDDIEMRVCRNEGRDNEDIAIETVEIYVQ